MEEKFLLKQNSYVIFMLNYAPVIIIGVIAILFFHDKIADLLEYLVVAGIFIGAMVKGIKPLTTNNRMLMVTDKNITLCKFKKKQPVVLVQYDNDNVVKIDGTVAADSGAYVVETKDGKVEVLEISALKPYKENLLKMNAALQKVFGERFVLEDKKETEEYISNGTVPKALLDADKGVRAQQIAWSVINTFLALLPTAMGILAILWVFFGGIKFLLEMLVHVLGG